MDETFGEVIDLKDKIEQATKSSLGERQSLKQKIEYIKEQQEDGRKSLSDKTLEKLKVQIELDILDQEIDMLRNYCEGRHQQQDDFFNSISDQIQMTDFEGAMMRLKTSIESAIIFYREENLQMELLKRSDLTRQLRIKYTEAEAEHRERLRRIEEEKRKAEDEKRKVEEEKRKAEEEKLRAEEEDRRREEEMRSAELIVPKSPEPWKSPLSGRSSVDTLSTFTQLLKW